MKGKVEKLALEYFQVCEKLRKLNIEKKGLINPPHLFGEGYRDDLIKQMSEIREWYLDSEYGRESWGFVTWKHSVDCYFEDPAIEQEEYDEALKLAKLWDGIKQLRIKRANLRTKLYQYGKSLSKTKLLK